MCLLERRETLDASRNQRAGAANPFGGLGQLLHRTPDIGSCNLPAPNRLHSQFAHVHDLAPALRRVQGGRLSRLPKFEQRLEVTHANARARLGALRCRELPPRRSEHGGRYSASQAAQPPAPVRPTFFRPYSFQDQLARNSSICSSTHRARTCGASSTTCGTRRQDGRGPVSQKYLDIGVVVLLPAWCRRGSRGRRRLCDRAVPRHHPKNRCRVTVSPGALSRWWRCRVSSSASSLQRHALPRRRQPRARRSALAG